MEIVIGFVVVLLILIACIKIVSQAQAARRLSRNMENGYAFFGAVS